MVCDKCTVKLNKLATIHKKPTGSGTSKMLAKNENKLLTMKNRFKREPEKQFRKCRICQRKCHHVEFHYCQDCAYQKGICGMCGTKIIEVGGYRQSLV